MKTARFVIEAVGFATLLGVARLFPRRLLLRVGAAAGLLAFYLHLPRRKWTLSNLREAFPEMSAAQIRRLARRCWRHFGRISFDTLAIQRLSAETVSSIVRCEGLENLRRALARGRGALFFSGHFGHWELVAVMQAYLGLRSVVVARPLDNPWLERMLTRLRSHSGNTVVHKRNAVREIIRALRQGLPVGILIDQDARRYGVFVPFLGRLASTTATPALLALRTGAALVPFFCTPVDDGCYRVTYEPEVRIEPTGDRDADIVRLTARCTAILERRVRERPELWLWMHRRWKTRPPESAVVEATDRP